MRLPPKGVVLVVFAGGVLGGLSRYALTRRWPVHGFPWATFAINTSGAFLLAVLVVLAARTRYLRPALGVGYLGTFTTFSSVVVSGDQLAASGARGLAAAYVLGSAAAGLAAAGVGLAAGRLLSGAS